MPDDNRTSAQRARDDSEREVFGAAPLRNPDGSPMETGHGSAFAAMSPATKANFHATAAAAAVDGVLALAKQLTDAVGKLAPLHDAAVKATAAARSEERRVAIEAATSKPDEPAPAPAPRPAPTPAPAAPTTTGL